MKTLGRDFHCCVTCEYYTGNRTPSVYFVHYESDMDEGKCYVNPYIGVSRKPIYCCPKWKKWSALK